LYGDITSSIEFMVLIKMYKRVREDKMEQLIYYDEEEEWSKALLLYNSALKEISTKLEILNNEFKLAHQYNPIEHITSRLKSAQSIARKMRIKQK